MNVAISGFGNEAKCIRDYIRSHGFKISNVVSADTKCVITRENINYMQFKSAKVKNALERKVPIISMEDSGRENILREIQKLHI